MRIDLTGIESRFEIIKHNNEYVVKCQSCGSDYKDFMYYHEPKDLYKIAKKIKKIAKKCEALNAQSL